MGALQRGATSGSTPRQLTVGASACWLTTDAARDAVRQGRNDNGTHTRSVGTLVWSLRILYWVRRVYEQPFGWSYQGLVDEPVKTSGNLGTEHVEGGYGPGIEETK